MRLTEDGAAVGYRAYEMDHNGHIADVELIRACRDVAAWTAALTSNGGARIEVWCRDREMPQVPLRRLRLGRPTMDWRSWLIECGLAHELGGQVPLDYLSGGVACTIDIPAPKEARP